MTNTQLGMDYFKLRLLAFLKESHPDKINDQMLIQEHSKLANNTYANAITSGQNHIEAKTLANTELYQDLRFSKYDTLFEILSEEFTDTVAEGHLETYASELLPLCESVFSSYDLHDDFAESPQYEQLYTELIGKITDYGLYSDIYSLYREVESYEIWTINTLDSYLKLIHYYAEIDCFEDLSDSVDLCDNLLELVEDIRITGEDNLNYSNKIQTYLFLSEIELDNKFVYVETDQYKLTFMTLFSLSTMKTDHKVLCEGIEKWFKGTINKSMLISGSQKHFFLFIKELKRKIKQTRKDVMQIHKGNEFL